MLQIHVTDCAKIQIVIPVHNRREITRLCLDRLVELGIPAWAGVIVVDDGSTDGTAEMIRSQHAWAKVVTGNGALWWTGAIVLGMRAAIEDGADCIVWLNDDSLPDNGAIETVVRGARSAQGICGGVCRGTDGNPVAYAGGYVRGTWPKALQSRDLEGRRQVSASWLHGNLVAIPEAVWRRCGLPDAEHMPHTLADISYTYSAYELGIPVQILPEATALAAANDSASYWSWLDARLGPRDLLRGLWNLKVWWYAPGIAWFQIRHFRTRGFVSLIILLIKLLMLSMVKMVLPSGWLVGLKRFRGNILFSLSSRSK